MVGREKLYAVVMAGGRGERFWPAGRSSRPKQLLPLASRKTMLEDTVQRLFPLIAPERLFVITNVRLVDEVRKILPIPPENVVGEPVGRDTAPCVALAAALVLRRDPEATMIMRPADHVIRPAKAFQERLQAAAQAAESGALVTLGIVPAYPATGYGYIHAGKTTADGFARVLEFKEKPDRNTAEKFVADGNYFWNSGMFVWKASSIVSEIDRQLPELGKKLHNWASGSDHNLDFAECPKISIDYGVMEKAEKVQVGKIDFYWNDLGSWSSIKDVLTGDEAGNAVRGKAVLLDAFGNVVYGDDDTLIGVIGLRDTAVVKSGNGILVCPLADEQKVKLLVEKIRKENLEKYL